MMQSDDDLEDFDPSEVMLSPGVELLSIHELRGIIAHQLGPEAEHEFMEFMVKKVVPKNPVMIESFLRGRTDFVSVNAYERLKEMLNGSE